MKRTPLRRKTPLKRRRPQGKRAVRHRQYVDAVWAKTREHSPKRAGFDRDHIVPLSYCWKHSDWITPEMAGSPENVRYIPHDDNVAKGYRLTDDSHAVLDEWRRKLSS